MTNRFSFHSLNDRESSVGAHLGALPSAALRRGEISTQDHDLKLRLYIHSHPYVGALIHRLIEGSVRGLLDVDTDYKPGRFLTHPDGTQETWPDGTPKPEPHLYEEFFKSLYDPSDLVDPQHYPVKDLNFDSDGAYSVYNWELFFHVPFTVAVHLSRNRRFADAQRWFHYLFDPTDDSDGPTPQRFWKVKPFHETDVKMIGEILINLSTGVDLALRDQTIDAINRWREAPFRPHIIARGRHTAYMYKTVMAYLDNLLDWGDSLFREDTGESINEATQLYVLAANILGPRPQDVPGKGSIRPQTYKNLRADLDEFGNALRVIESELPFDLAPLPTDVKEHDDRFRTLRSVGESLYFCVPRNDKLFDYWHKVADRLFKIRNSLNLQGIFRQLPLFEPPIDPALLARAVAAGVDIDAAVSGINQPLPLVRFTFLLQKALEVCQEVKSLGSNLLAAIEKGDGEQLTVLRARHESAMLGLAEFVRYGQLQEAAKAREGLERSLANVAQRYVYNERLLGRHESEITLPEFEALDGDSFEKLKLKTREPLIAMRPVNVNLASGVEGVSDGHKVSSYEVRELEHLASARAHHESARGLDMVASNLAQIPQTGAQAEPLGVGAAVVFGGQQLARMISSIASADRAMADQETYLANLSAKIGGFDRREQEWAYQSNLAAGEINQIYKQLRAAQIREAVAKREWENHQQQMRNAQEIETFLTDEKTGKVTNAAFYAWMKREVRGLYGQCYQLAFDIARKAERALQRELGDRNLTFLRFDHRSGREGLFAGERLYLDIKRMEMAYHDLNRREYELTQHVSLLQLDPQALVQLRTEGRCTFKVPEALYDLHCPGHYFRRIKSVAVSVPGVTGPHLGVHCTITLLKSTVRTTPARPGAGEYARQGTEDERFEDHFGSSESIVTSSAQADSGLFETNLRDERYLPFEGAGAESQWQIELPNGVTTFDHATIADVVMHIRYTAREGGVPLRAGAAAHPRNLLGDGADPGNARLLSVRHEFPLDWASFKSSPAGANVPLTLTIREEHYPYWSRGHRGEVNVSYLPSGGTWTVGGSLTSSTSTLTLRLNNSVSDLWVLLSWKWKS